MMNIKRKYAICVDKNRILFLDQLDERIISVYEMSDISNATLFNSKQDVLDAIKDLTTPSETEWEYSRYYNFDEIDIVEVFMMYKVMDREDWIEEKRIEN